MNLALHNLQRLICHKLQTTSLLIVYHNSSTWLDTREASNRDRITADFTTAGYLKPCQSSSHHVKEFLHISLFTNTLLTTGAHNSREGQSEFCVCGNGQIPLSCAQLTGRGGAYISSFKS